MDSIYTFPMQDNDILHQIGGSYDESIFENSMPFDAGFREDHDLISMREEMFFDVEFLSNFGLLVDAAATNHSEEGHEENQGDDCSSAGAADHGHGRKPGRDRSKTIVSERKRRGRMKDELYELRSLVPNITKMDKTSIIADAIVYVQGLQRQAKKLTEEISFLECSSHEEQQILSPPGKKNTVMQRKKCSNLYRGKILGVKAHVLGDKRFYVKVECSREDGAASFLYEAIDSLTCFELESSIISCTSDRYIFTTTLSGRGMREEISLWTIENWVKGVLLKEGFQFEATAM